MINFIELNVSIDSVEQPVMVRKTSVVAIIPKDNGTTLYLNSGAIVHVKQSYDEIKEQFKFE